MIATAVGTGRIVSGTTTAVLHHTLPPIFEFMLVKAAPKLAFTFRSVRGENKEEVRFVLFNHFHLPQIDDFSARGRTLPVILGNTLKEIGPRSRRAESSLCALRTAASIRRRRCDSARRDARRIRLMPLPDEHEAATISSLSNEEKRRRVDSP